MARLGGEMEYEMERIKELGQGSNMNAIWGASGTRMRNEKNGNSKNDAKYLRTLPEFRWTASSLSTQAMVDENDERMTTAGDDNKTGLRLENITTANTYNTINTIITLSDNTNNNNNSNNNNNNNGNDNESEFSYINDSSYNDDNDDNDDNEELLSMSPYESSNNTNNSNVTSNKELIDSLPLILSKFDALFPFYRLSDKDCKKLSLFVLNQFNHILKIFCNSQKRSLQVIIYFNNNINKPKSIFFYNNDDSQTQVDTWNDIKMDQQYRNNEMKKWNNTV